MKSHRDLVTSQAAQMQLDRVSAVAEGAGSGVRRQTHRGPHRGAHSLSCRDPARNLCPRETLWSRRNWAGKTGEKVKGILLRVH